MNRVPQSVDELMWLVAEQNDAAAIEAFDKRYPEFRKELLSRIELVRGLKMSKPGRVPIPVFQPVVKPFKLFGMPRWALAAATSMVLFAFGFASYRAILSASATAVVPTTTTQVSPSPVTTPFRVNEGVGHGSMSTVEDPTEIVTVPRDTTERLKPSGLLDGPAPGEMEVTIKSNQTTLVEALREVERQSGLQLVIGPGLSDDLVSPDFSGPALKVLEAMAKEYGFSVFDQGDGTVNVIPAVDANARPPASEDKKLTPADSGHP